MEDVIQDFRINSTMKADVYRAEQEFGTLLEVLEQNRDLAVVENAEAWEDDEKPPQPTAGERLKVPGSIPSIVERLDDELTRSLQHIDPHAAEYIERLSDEQFLYNKILRTLLYTEDICADAKLEVPQDNLNRVVMRRVEHIYFKVCPSCIVVFSSSDHLNSPRKSLPSLKTRHGSQYQATSTRK